MTIEGHGMNDTVQQQPVSVDYLNRGLKDKWVASIFLHSLALNQKNSTSNIILILILILRFFLSYYIGYYKIEG